MYSQRFTSPNFWIRDTEKVVKDSDSVVNSAMDSTLAILNASANLVTKGVGRKRSSGFWGEGTRGSLNSRFCSIHIQPCKSLNTRKFKHGIACAVYTPDMSKETPDMNKETVVHNLMQYTLEKC